MTEALSKPTVLVVDDSPENIDVLKAILEKDYKVKVALNGAKALKIVENQELPDIILLDIIMPEMDGLEVCRRLKSNIKTRKIPVIFVTTKGEPIDEEKGFEIGAVDYIAKPISPAIVKARIKTHLSLYDQSRLLEEKVRERTAELEETRLEIIRRLGIAAEFKDNETGMHIYRIGHISRILGLSVNMSEYDADVLMQAATMHDVGKIGIPDKILLKPARLTAHEMKIMQKHTIIGSRIIGDHPSILLKTAKTIALTHHEKWDGGGYPLGLKKTDIPLGGRIVAIADVFDALINKRHYKDAWTLERVLEYFQENKEKHFDPDLVDLFFENKDKILQISKKYSDFKNNESK